MASVAKRLRQRFVVPPLVGSTPIVRPAVKRVKIGLTVTSISRQREIPRTLSWGIKFITVLKLSGIPTPHNNQNICDNSSQSMSACSSFFYAAIEKRVEKIKNCVILSKRCQAEK